jgi:hypothetical protein
MLQNSTGLYRHKSHILCGHFALAITTLMRLYDEHLDWHFYWSNNPNDLNAQPPWQEKTIIDGWESELAPHQAFKQMLDALDMQWSKVTHLWTLDVETTSQRGLNHAEITSMSKHVVSAIDDCYIRQLLPVTLKVIRSWQRLKRMRRTLLSAHNSLMCQVLNWINWKMFLSRD